MWIGRGFDTDGDGDSDFLVVHQITPEQQKANAKAAAGCMGVALVCAVLFGVMYVTLDAMDWGVRWWSSNSAKVASWAAFLATWCFIGVVLIAVAVTMFSVLVHKQQRSITPDAKQATTVFAGKSAGAKPSPTKPCRKCALPVIESYLFCPRCKIESPYPS